MTRANVAELKARLSGYLRMVRRGESVLVCERNRPVARIVPVGDEELDPRERSIESDPLLKRARASLARLLTKTDVVSFAPSILGEAKALVSRYPLRAPDSLQLACCKELVTRVPGMESLFVTADGKLAAAARN